MDDAKKLTDEMFVLVDQMTKVEFQDQLDLMIDLRALARAALATPGDTHATRSQEMRRFRFILAMLEMEIDELFRAQTLSSPERDDEMSKRIVQIFDVLRAMVPAVPPPGPRPH